MTQRSREGGISVEPLGGGVFKIRASGPDWLDKGKHAGCELILDEDELDELIFDLERARRSRVTVTVQP
jgi:hypothetical protein